MSNNERNQSLKPWQRSLHEVIFEAETAGGKRFDLILIICIAISVTVVMLDSVASLRERFEGLLHSLEWCFTILFTIEYVLRLMCIGRPLKYAGSFFGIVDLLAILPTYIGLFLPGTHYLAVVRILRVLRIFRVLKLIQYLGEAAMLVKALRASLHKITIFVTTVMTLVVVLGSIMYLVEGEAHGFTSIPKSIYWAIVTVTTVGYGDFSPQTSFGQVIAAVTMIMGYSIIAVPTGIVTVELSEAFRKKTIVQACPQCSKEGHEDDANYCKFCGAKL